MATTATVDLTKAIRGEQVGSRDVHWCFQINEPVIVTYRDLDGERARECQVCGWCAPIGDEAWEDRHPFYFHINRFLHAAPDA